MPKFNLPGYAHDRMFKRNQNLLICVVGGTGSGKTYLGLYLAQKIDEHFNAHRVVFRSDEFLKVLNWGRLKKGDVVMFDEAGTGIPAREWQSFSNKAINFILQTFRYRNLCIIFTVPTFKYIDSQARGLFHIVIETNKIDYEKELCIARVKFLETNPITGKIYAKFPRAYLSNDSAQKIKYEFFAFHRPTEDLVDAYEEKKQKFGRELGHSLEREMAQKRRWEIEASQTLNFDDALKKVRLDPESFKVTRRNGQRVFSQDLIAGKLGVGSKISWRVRNVLKAESEGR